MAIKHLFSALLRLLIITVLRSLEYLSLFIILWLLPVLRRVLPNWFPPLPKNIAKSKDEILLQSALQLSRKIRTQELSSEQVVRTFISRIQEVNGSLNAVVGHRFEEAIEEARKFDLAIKSGTLPVQLSEENAPFLGIPFTAKEAFAITGLANTSGMVNRKSFRATSNADVVQLLCDSGAIALALTNCSELCMWWESSNVLFGCTNNPYDVRRIVGGSSGGEACIVSAAGSVIGVGSDIGGSIRMPAMFNGVFGHKPTPGIVSNQGQHPVAVGEKTKYLTTGPICRYADDLRAMFKLMAKPNQSLLSLDKMVNLKEVKYFYMENDGGNPAVSSVHPDLVQAQKNLIMKLEDSLGVRVEKVNVENMKYSLEIWTNLMSTEGGGPRFVQLMAGEGLPPVNPFLEQLKWFVGKSDHTLPAIFLALVEEIPRMFGNNIGRYVKMNEELKKEWSEILRGDAVLLYPSHPKPAPYHNQPLIFPFNFAYTGIFNMLGFPATQCPLGIGSQGLPLGIQVVGRQYQDHLTLSVAKHIENLMGGWVNPGI